MAGAAGGSRLELRWAVGLAFAAAVAAGCGTGVGEPQAETGPTLRQSGGPGFEAFKAGTWRDRDGAYVVDGDYVLQGNEELAAFYAEHVQRGALTANLSSIGLDRWSNVQKQSLSYCVSPVFGYRHAAVVAAMQEAATAWEQVANVHFVYLASEDSRCSAQNPFVLFDVSPASLDAPYYARSFLPHNPRAIRNVLIHRTAFYGAPNLTGILRHELGHVLGFRHEHTRVEAGRCFEDDNWRALTAYDLSSVMYYPWCGGRGWAFLLSPLDAQGAQRLYGKPGAAPTAGGAEAEEDTDFFIPGEANGVKANMLSKRRGWDWDH